MKEYGLRLSDVREWPAGEVADLVVWVPAGGAIWRSIGGPPAITDETRWAQENAHRLEVLDWRIGRRQKGKKPEPIKPPIYAHEKRKTESKASKKAERFLRRQN